MKHTPLTSPACSTTAPSATATAWTRWRASTIPARLTVTLIASMAWSLKAFVELDA
jgi:hypothetical protein